MIKNLMENSQYANKNNILISELKLKGIKHNPQEIIAIVKRSNGDIIFLEKGNEY
jgi:hypothetical protein